MVRRSFWPSCSPNILNNTNVFLEEEDEGAEEEPLGSEDDISDEDAQELYDTDNVVVCQYDKITRTRLVKKLFCEYPRLLLIYYLTE